MLVQDTGPRDAKIMLVGEAPGEEEERIGKPFVGAAGKMLRQMLSHVGIDYNSCYVTNVMNVRPPGNNFRYFYNGKLPSRELERGWQQLQNKVASIRPDVTILLGNEPLKALCNKSGISNWRGTWLSFRGINVLPTYHPSYVLRQYGDHPIVELDLMKAATQKPAAEPTFILQPTLKQTIDWLSTALDSDSRIGFDIETIGKHVRCLGLSSNRSTICIPFIKFPSSDLVSPSSSTIVQVSGISGHSSSYWSASEEIAIIDAIDKLFRSGIEIVGQNSISFDAPLLAEEFGLTIANHYIDTMHLWHCLYPELPMSLSFLCSVLTNYPNYWTEMDSTNDKSLWRYNCFDALVTLEISYKLEKEAKETKV